MKRNVSRKDFIKNSALGFAGLAITDFSGINILKNKKDKVNVAFIGTGNRGHGLIYTIKHNNISQLNITACCDMMPDNLKRGIARAGGGSVKALTDYRRVLDDKSIDAVFITTPIFEHYPMAMDAISAGKHIYLEKTMTTDINQAVELARRMKREKKLVLQVGHQYRYYDMYPQLKSFLAENLIGKVTRIECQYNRNSDWENGYAKDPKTGKIVNWRLYQHLSGGLLGELSSHQIDVANWLMDATPEKVVAMGDVNFFKNDDRTCWDNVHAVYNYPNGVKMNVISILSNEFDGYRMRLFGNEGTIEIGRNKSTLYLERKKKEKIILDGVTGATKEALDNGKGIDIYTDKVGKDQSVYALEAFADCIINNKKPFCDAEKGMQTAISVHMANNAVESGKTEVWKKEYNL